MIRAAPEDSAHSSKKQKDVKEASGFARDGDAAAGSGADMRSLYI
jgi:hypothetical protein